MRTLDEVVEAMKAQEKPDELDVKNMEDSVKLLKENEYINKVIDKLVASGAMHLLLDPDPIKGLKFITSGAFVCGFDIARRMYSPSLEPLEEPKA